jgi:hypothetical protein
MIDPLRKAMYAALIAVGAAASAQFWSRALTVHDGLPSSHRLAVPAVGQREIPATVLRPSATAPRVVTVPIIRRPALTWIRQATAPPGRSGESGRPATPSSQTPTGGAAPQPSSASASTPSVPVQSNAEVASALVTPPTRQAQPSNPHATRAKPATRATPSNPPATPATPATPAIPPAHPEDSRPNKPGKSDSNKDQSNSEGGLPATPPGQENGHGNENGNEHSK